MSTANGVLASSPLKVPAVEVVNLLSDSEVGNEPIPDELLGGEEDGEDQWSLYEDALAEMVDNGPADDCIWPSICEYYRAADIQVATESCTSEEALAFRKRLRLVGEDKFIEETVGAGTITARKLCTAFGIRTPPFLIGEPDDAFLPLLGLGICRELSKRVKLPQYNTIDDVVSLLRKSKNIIVLTGAGISTSLGIPDFRSKDTGLYSLLEYLGLSHPQEVFDISIFREDPSIFYSVAKDILPSTNRYSPTHAFIRLLQDKGRLLTNFTQNIDNLEGHAGISPEKLIQCHGSFATASCVECKHKVDCEVIYKDLKAGRVARCDRCIQHIRKNNGGGVKRKRNFSGHIKSKKKRESYEDSTDEEDSETAGAGVMKPDITFFGEDLPDEFGKRLVDHDKGLVDLVLVIGTSLKVAPVSEVTNFLPPEIPQIYISRDPCAHVDFDVDLLGDCDTIVTELCRRAGWDLQHEMIPKNCAVDVQLREGHKSRFDIKVRK